MNRPSTSSCTRSGSASDRSILLIATIGPEPERQRLPGHEARLRHRALGGIHQDQHAIHHAQDPLDLAAEVRVARRVDDVDLHTLPAHGRVLGQDGDPPLALERVGIHDPLLDLLVGAEGARLPEHLIHQRRLAVVDVRNDGEVTDHSPSFSLNGRGPDARASAAHI